ncbi:hypothetical protein SPBRAN_1491 [uncultured Candidatus Thioglobus sp.]|nr:hypothetical protein SPBRAN_1491 [uncultured Candidatus Thioglobus sp.]
MNKKQLLTTLLLSFSFMNVSYAEPSEQETIDYIEAKSSSCEDSTFNDKDEHGAIVLAIQTSMKINNKMLVVHELTDGLWARYTGVRSLSSRESENRSWAMLQDLSSDISIKNGSTISLMCNSVNCFQTKNRHRTKWLDHEESTRPLGEWGEWEEESSSNSKQFYTFCDAEGAQKIAKALSHLIKLNGGKTELF